MNNKAIKFIQNFSYTITSNLLSLMISALIIMVVPKLIGVEEYGYWQLYLFYSSYVGFLHFGWNDGIYLRYGGTEYNKLDKTRLNTQFYMLVLFQLLVALSSFIFLFWIDVNPQKLFVFRMTLICMMIMNTSTMLLYILQCTNKIKEYARVTIIDRLFYVSLLSFLLLGNIRKFEIMIIADLFGKLMSLVLGIYYCRDIVLLKKSAFSFDFKETKKNISIGIKLLLSNVASMLIVGIVRLGIEKRWDVNTFGKISLTLSVTNLMIVFVNAIGLIMFPILRRTNQNKLVELYVTLRDILMVLMLGALLFYYPLKSILLGWLPEYSDGLAYMAILLPVSVYEGKMSLLINTYLKTLREEKAMLKINGAILSLSIFLTFLATFVFSDLDLAVISIVSLLALRSIVAEVYLSKILKINIAKDVLLETLTIIFFILNARLIESWFGALSYAMVYGVYILMKKRELLLSKKRLTKLLKN